MTLEYFVKKLLSRCDKDGWEEIKDLVFALKKSQKQKISSKIQGYIDSTERRLEEKEVTPSSEEPSAKEASQHEITFQSE